MTDRVEATINKTVGSVKEVVGGITGNTHLQEQGSEQKTKGHDEYKGAQYEDKKDAVTNSVSGNLKSAAGNLTGSEDWKAEGSMEKKKGDVLDEKAQH